MSARRMSNTNYTRCFNYTISWTTDKNTVITFRIEEDGENQYHKVWSKYLFKHPFNISQMELRFRDNSRVNVFLNNEPRLPEAIAELFHPVLGQCLVICPRDAMTSKQRKVGLVEMELRVRLFPKPPFNPVGSNSLTDDESAFQFGEVNDGFKGLTRFKCS